MINKITKPSSSLLESFILPWSVYPYANYIKYGFDSRIFSIYELNGKIITKYDDSLQLCFNEINDAEYLEVFKFAKRNNVRMISGKQEIIRKFATFFENSKAYYGYIFENDCILDVKDSNKIMYASSKQQFEEIAKLVCDCNSDNKSYYTITQYFNQIYSRFTLKYCRNWICTQDAKTIGHIATYAETDKFAVIGGLAVQTNYRKQGIGKNLLCFANNELIKEGKIIYWFCYNPNLQDFYHSISSKCYPCGKLLLQK